MKKLSLILVALVAVAGAAVWGFKSVTGPNIEAPMKRMQMTYKAAMDSNNMADFKNNVTTLQTTIQNASTLEYDGSKPNQEIYRAGMHELDEHMAAVNQAIADNDLDKAKAALAKVNDSKKKYHKALGE
ncbi:cytochrome b562 [Hydromonas duriensis]|uniref:Soluble cytochrome b562 n=1 Tax=Hydromonas duriensis TaxID=1527608 RepID=A0A4R6Y5V8_9BURK|nr:cytochrome b562 [Hydromonas duriensis]TDR30901.1 soluble cytochrome b562 [Hydromonas duriensis]